MAGGKGTRIASIASDVPKPMIRVCGKPILEHQIENLKACGLTDITLVVGHLGHIIQEYFGDGSQLGVHIDYFVETMPLGTAGALFQMDLREDFLLLCGDVIIDVDFQRFIKFHRDHDAWASLISHPNGHPYDSSLLVTETLPPQEPGGLPVDTHRVVRWMNKEDDRLYYQNRVNAGIEILSPLLLRWVEDERREFLDERRERRDENRTSEDERRETRDENPSLDENQGKGNSTLYSLVSPLNQDSTLYSLVSRLKKVDLDRDVLKPAIPSGKIFAYDTPEYIKDMGTPDRYHEVERDLQTGLVHARNLSQPQRAIFLDRDGTLNKYVGFLSDPAQFDLLEGASEAVKLINKSGYLAIVVTNQPVIARGEASWDTLRLIHDKMETLLGREGAFIDALYLCPHHPDKGFEGERPEYKRVCDCRKPAPGLLLQAARDLHIDLSQSYMIGDDTRDTQAAQAAHLRDALQIPTNQPHALLQAVQRVLGE